MGEQGIREFWSTFAATREDLVHPADPDAMSRLLEALRLVDERFYFHVGEHDNGVDLILSAEGNCDALPLLRRVRDDAPEVAGWDFIAAFDGDLVIGRRNTSIYPEDENGDVLFRMARSGDDLCVERPVDFSLLFPSAKDQNEFLETLREQGLQGRAADRSEGDVPWDVIVTQTILPTHANITEFEKRLETLATPFRGRNDGWGCFQQG